MKKFWKSMFLPFLLAAVLTACSAQADAPSLPEPSAAPAADPEPSTHSASLPESSAASAPEEETSQEIKRTLSCGAAVDATVSCPDGIDFSSISAYGGSLHSFDPEAVKNVLLGEGEASCQKDEEAAGSLLPGAVYHLYTAGDGGTLMVFGETITYDKDGLGKTSLYSSVAPWLHLDREDAFYNGDLFPTDKDLSFASRKQGYEDLRQVLGKLGVQVSAQYDCYAVEESALRKAEERMAEEAELETEAPADGALGAVSSGAERAVELPAGGEQGPGSRECYLYRLYTDIGGVPVTSHENGSVDEETYLPGTVIEALYAAGGLCSLHVSHTFEAGEAQPPAQALDAEGALEKLDALYQQGTLEDAVEVQEIALEYVPVAGASRAEVRLVPAWRFGVLRTRTYPGKTNPQETMLVPEYEQVMINALTGEALPLDQGSIL